MADSGAKFDYIVVGAGSSGCVLGNRLSAGGQSTVAVVEAGPRDRSFWIHLPIGYGRTMWDPAVNWKFQTEPEPNLGDVTHADRRASGTGAERDALVRILASCPSQTLPIAPLFVLGGGHS